MLRSSGLLILMMFVAPAFADGPSYNYFLGTYQDIEIDGVGGDIDGDGLGIAGSVEIADSWHGFASYTSADFDFSVDFDQLAIGGGYHSPLNENVDLVARLAYIQLDASALGFSADDDGFGVSVGMRGNVAERVEVEGYIDYTDLDSSGDDTSFSGAAWYEFTDSFSGGMQLGFGDDVSSWGIAGRFFFD